MKPSLEFTVSREDFLRELALVQAAAEKKTTIPILGNVLLEARDGQVTLTASDLELAIRATCPAQVEREGASTIPAHKLCDYVRLLPDGEIKIAIQENAMAAMRGGRNKAKLAGMSRESFPEIPEVPPNFASLPLQSLVAMIERVSFAISKEESRFTLNAALLIAEENALTLVATDGHRLAFTRRSSVTGSAGGFRRLLPKTALSEIAKLAGAEGAGDTLELGEDENHLFFHIGPRLLIARKLSGNFPDYARVLPPSDGYTAVQFDCGELQGAIQRVAEFADERSQAVRLMLSRGEAKLFATCIEAGESEETLPCDYQGQAFEIGFNAQYLLHFLKVSDGPRVLVHVKDEKSAGELRPFGLPAEDEYRYVVMPMRV